jgi:hypothetical protein
VGLIRKLTAVSTLGAVKYTSRREAQTKRALAEAKLAKARQRAMQSAPDSVSNGDAPEVLAVEHVEAHLRGEYPDWKLTTRERALLRKARKEETQRRDA